jgi:hypothetical protein
MGRPGAAGYRRGRRLRRSGAPSITSASPAVDPPAVARPERVGRARSVPWSRVADLVVAVAAVGAAAFLVVLGRGLTFFADEWAVIENRPLGLDSFLRPFNEHWLGIQVTVYRALFELVGLSTYLPYLALLIAIHVIVALEVYVIARRATYPLLAAGITVIVLLFGSGFEDLFWAMQIGFSGAIALGFGALLLLDGRPTRWRGAAATLLLTLAVMTSGFGLFMLALVGLDLLVDRRRWRWLPATFVPAAVWLAWFVAIGRAGVAAHGSPFTAEALANVPSFIVGGLGAAYGGAVGLGDGSGLGLAAAGVFVLLLGFSLHDEGRAAPLRAIACVGAIVAMYALLGLVRASDGADAAAYTRYTYLSGMFALLAIASLVGRRPLPARPVTRAVAIGVTAGVVTMSLVWNVRFLVAGRGLFADRADLTRALVELGLTDPLPAGLDPTLSLILVPSPESLRTIVARYGSPLVDRLAGDAVPPIPDAARAEALGRATNPPDWLLAGCGGDRPQPLGCERFVTSR